jgi:glycosyltransferase involved in cell wall biosynthesis
MKRLLFISGYDATFVKRDQKILSDYFQLITAPASTLKKNMLNYLWLFIFFGIKARQCAVVYCWFADFRARTGVFWANIFRKKSVVVIGGYEMREFMNVKYSKNNTPNCHLLYCLKNADLVFTVSNDHYNRLLQLFPVYAGKIQNIPNGIYFKPDKETKLTKKDIILTVCLGSDPQRFGVKGLGLFCDTAKLMPEYEFVIVGPSGELLQLLSKCKLSKNVRLVPPQSESGLESYYKSARIYCQFSRFESFGLALIEAMYWRCIPVVTPLPELVERLGDTGFVLSEPKASEAKIKIDMALSSGADLGEKASEWVRTHYDIKKREKAVLENINRILELL